MDIAALMSRGWTDEMADCYAVDVESGVASAETETAHRRTAPHDTPLAEAGQDDRGLHDAAGAHGTWR